MSQQTSELRVKIKATVEHEDIETETAVIYGVILKTRIGNLESSKFIPLGVEDK